MAAKLAVMYSLLASLLYPLYHACKLCGGVSYAEIGGEQEVENVQWYDDTADS